jgi:hypothetical protein
MKLKNLFLCDAATPHPDNTFSVLRGGINIFNIPLQSGMNPTQLPPIHLALVATIELEVTEMGRLHNVELVLMDMDGHRVLPEIRANFQPPTSTKKGGFNFILNTFLNIPKAGEYCFYINVDGHELGTQPLNVLFHQLPIATQIP